ncbi:MAG: GNAT family N-acetyltransferase, partial [Candidatus Manganitrophaceae bacterium]
VGMVLMAKCIENAVAQGWSEFDFLRGPEAYKSHWTSNRRETCQLTLFPPGIKNHFYRLLSGASRSARGWVKRSLPESWVERLRAGIAGQEAGTGKSGKARDCE